ncbi:hypothetical protein [Massilia sp. Root335]|uniref:hypothetical protein n=1 Tax=Massilia sp. Root335 TaxID=1736517 RepID=UPI000AB4A0E7|nr:hypothetical protein [Massilia sp. Root335]
MVPAPGSTLKITSLGSRENLLGKPVTAVPLVGHEGAPMPMPWRLGTAWLV